MTRQATRLEDIALLAGVSISTASRALNDHPGISSRTKQRIWSLAREHDYPFRRHLPSGPIGADASLVIVTPHLRGRPLPLSHPFFLEMMASIGEEARNRDCDFTVSHTTPTNFEDLVIATTTSRATGVIFLGQSMLHAELNRLADTGARFVVWGAQMPKQKYCSVGSDNLSGGRRATSHLVRLGKRRIVFLGTTDPEAMLRRRGYREALEDSGIAWDPELVVEVDFEMEPAENAIARLLRRNFDFDAIFASSDLIALGAIRALRQAGKKVPEDVSVVGYDDMLLARLSTPTLTTIRQDTSEAGRIMVDRVLDPVADNEPILLPTELIVRESCGA